MLKESTARAFLCPESLPEMCHLARGLYLAGAARPQQFGFILGVWRVELQAKSVFPGKEF